MTTEIELKDIKKLREEAEKKRHETAKQDVAAEAKEMAVEKQKLAAAFKAKEEARDLAKQAEAHLMNACRILDEEATEKYGNDEYIACLQAIGNRQWDSALEHLEKAAIVEQHDAVISLDSCKEYCALLQQRKPVAAYARLQQAVQVGEPVAIETMNGMVLHYKQYRNSRHAYNLKMRNKRPAQVELTNMRMQLEAAMQFGCPDARLAYAFHVIKGMGYKQDIAGGYQMIVDLVAEGDQKLNAKISKSLLTYQSWAQFEQLSKLNSSLAKRIQAIAKLAQATAVASASSSTLGSSAAPSVRSKKS